MTHIYVVVETDSEVMSLLPYTPVTDLLMAFGEHERDRAYAYAKEQRDLAVRIHRDTVRYHVEIVPTAAKGK
jgi:hypothetical protein